MQTKPLIQEQPPQVIMIEMKLDRLLVIIVIIKLIYNLTYLLKTEDIANSWSFPNWL